jgi:WD40-like Beta Propeller Repeat
VAISAVALGLALPPPLEEFLGFLADHLPDLAKGLLGVLALAALAAFAILMTQEKTFAAFALLGGALVGGAVVYISVALFSSLFMPFIEQRESVAARSLVGIVGNGSIAFVSDAYGNVDIYTIDPEGADTPTRLTLNAADDTEPAWSPDGDRIAFTRRFEAGKADIYTVKADGTDEHRLTDHPAADSQPAWSPDGDRIAFTSVREGNAEIHVMNADGSEIKRLTTRTGPDTQPVWSPDSERIAFTTERGNGDPEIYLMDADGTNPTPLTTASARDAEPNWGPDGAHLAFVSDRDGDSDVYRYREIGGKPSVEAVTEKTADDSWPAWSPDGGELAFIRINDIGDPILYVETNPKRKGEQARRVTRQPVREVRLSWQPVRRQGLELPEEGDVAYRYAPLVYLHPGEARLPMDAAEFVRRSDLPCSGDDARKVEAGNLLDIISEHCTGRAGVLALERGYEFGSRKTVAGVYSGVPVYWERLKNPAAIVYWFFYASSKTAGAVGVHEGDWEGISICLGADDRPTRIAYNQHKAVETRAWPWAPKFGTHPLVYSALGSHASYPENLGRRKKTQDLTDEGPIWPTWRALREVTKEEWYGFLGPWGRHGTSPTGPSPMRRGGTGCPRSGARPGG